MSDPKEPKHDPDELDLDAETVKDLEVDSEAGEDVKGGGTAQCCRLSIVSCIHPN